MASYFQMGHDTESLVGEPGLERFGGVILSPVNRDPTALRRYVGEFRERGKFDVILDPQTYCPWSDRRHLPSHPYFPADFETADLSSPAWFENLAKGVAKYGVDLGVDAVASPMIIPNRWGDSYFEMCAVSYSALASQLAGQSIRSLMSLCVRLEDLSSIADGLRVASIATSVNPKCCYLVIQSDVSPRKELQNADNLASLMVLIASLEASGCKVLVSHCSSDMLLFKAAGASDCSTGKFWNLRRFTRSRFEDSDEGGRVVPYWFEHSLLAFLREADVARVRRNFGPENLMVEASDNPFARIILEQFAVSPREAWVAWGWRQYLAWFGATELKLSGRDALQQVDQWLRMAEQRWKKMDELDVLLDEPFNDGAWIRKWRQALIEFRKALPA